MIEPLQIPVTPSGSLLQPKPRRVRPRAGFSLVELSLALLVVSIGLISLIGLFPASLDMSKRAINETYASFLADSIIASFSEAANHVPWANLATYRPIAPNTIMSPAGVPNTDVFWENSNDLRVDANSGIQTLLFTAGSTEAKWLKNYGVVEWILPDNWSMEDHALRYDLQIVNDPLNPRIKKLYLKVWMGAFGNTANETPEVFYAEIFRHRVVN